MLTVVNFIRRIYQVLLQLYSENNPSNIHLRDIRTTSASRYPRFIFHNKRVISLTFRRLSGKIKKRKLFFFLRHVTNYNK